MAVEHGMIEPFVDGQVREDVVSYGVSSYGYDIRVADEFKIFTNINTTVIDPKSFESAVLPGRKGASVYRAAKLLCPGSNRRVFSDSAGCPDGLPGKVDLRAVRHHR